MLTRNIESTLHINGTYTLNIIKIIEFDNVGSKKSAHNILSATLIRTILLLFTA